MARQGAKKTGGKAPPKGAAKPLLAPAAKLSTAAADTAGPAKSPLAPRFIAPFPRWPGKAGNRTGGIKYKDRPDLLMMVLAPGSQVAGVFTKSKTSSAPVDWCRKLLPGATARSLS
jgi:hypothetical protein